MSSPRSLPSTEPLPVYLLTGFLGSGKTTLLSRLVHSAAFADTAVIINEFGEVGLDHVLIGPSSDDSVVLLDSGCLCCAMSASLPDSLETLFYRRLRGEVPAFTRVVIETSGLADPAPLINTLAGDPSVARHYRFAGAVTTVDAVHGLETLEQFREAATQVAIADRLILTKTDLCHSEALVATLDALRLRNPVADIRQATLDAVQGETAFFEDLHAIMPPPAAAPMTVTRSAPLERLSHVLRYGIASYVLHVPGAITWGNYARWVQYLQWRGGERLLRVKAILQFEDGEIYAIHGVRHLFSPPEPVLTHVPDKQLNSIVMIVQSMSSDEVTASMAVLSPGAVAGAGEAD